LTRAANPARPHTTLQTFSRFAGETGPAKTNIAADAFRQQGSNRRFAPAYQTVLNAIRLGHEWGDYQQRVDDAVQRAKAGFGPKYREAAAGWSEHVAAEPISELKLAPSAVWSAAGLDVNVNPHFVVRRSETDAIEVMRVWVTDKPPSALTVEVSLGLMAMCMDKLCPGGTPTLLDVRRNEVYRTRRYRDRQLTRWLPGEAAAFASTWPNAA